MNLKDYYPTIPTERSRYAKLYKFDSTSDLHDFELRSSMNKVSSSHKLPSLETEIDFDNAIMMKTSNSLNKAPHTSIRS